MAYYVNGTLISGANTLPKMTMAEYLALPVSERPTYWECTDKDYDEISAENVSYGDGTVEDALDTAMPKFIGNKIYDFAASGNESWTATQDCWISGAIKYTTSQGNYDTYVQIDGKYVATCYVQNNAALGTVCAPCKKGQTVTTGRNASSDSYSLLKAYAMI